jgi:LacI family transcriptional regulator
MEKGFQVTIGDIASKLKVSNVTVSKALRDGPDISSNMRQRVKDLAREMGYIPNYLARNLSSNHTRTIGVVIPQINHSFYSSIVKAVYDAAFENGYEVILTVSQENSVRELQNIRSLLAMRVEGILISLSQQSTDYSYFQTVIEHGVQLTFMDRSPDSENYFKVKVDNIGGAFAATEQAIKVGYRYITHFAGFPHTSVGRERRAGFIEAMRQYNVDIRPEWIITGGFGQSDGYESFMQMYRDRKLPECIFAVDYPVAIGIYEAVRQLGLKIPDDIDLISFGNDPLNTFIHPAMSYVEQPTYQLGRIAFDMTIENIYNKEQAVPRMVTLPTRLVLKDTCV